MHVYVHYFVCKFNEFEWISGKNEAETYRKCVKKSLLFLFGGGKIWVLNCWKMYFLFLSDVNLPANRIPLLNLHRKQSANWYGIYYYCWRNLESLSGKQKHRTSSMKTSVLLRQNIRTFAQRSPMFYCFRTATSHSPFPPLQKKFLKISYISYTTAPDALCLLTISGEG